ncbi:hypothetical protein HMPREF0262_00394 [Clostridium sp. ATCC 29733]|nr:hypothetical protein HMPREF0262_00394 [Clostridium sp. ATCC 29733]
MEPVFSTSSAYRRCSRFSQIAPFRQIVLPYQYTTAAPIFARPRPIFPPFFPRGGK